jgi:hypothetical protein
MMPTQIVAAAPAAGEYRPDCGGELIRANEEAIKTIPGMARRGHRRDDEGHADQPRPQRYPPPPGSRVQVS